MADPAAEASSLLQAASAATKGPGSPAAAQAVTSPPALSLRMLAFGGPALSAMICWIIWILGGVGLTIGSWTFVAPVVWPESVAADRVLGLVSIAMSLCAILGVVVFRLASGGLKRAEVRVGPAGIVVETGEPSG